LGVYIVHERSSHVLSFVSLYFAVVYSARSIDRENTKVHTKRECGL